MPTLMENAALIMKSLGIRPSVLELDVLELDVLELEYNHPPQL